MELVIDYVVLFAVLGRHHEMVCDFQGLVHVDQPVGHLEMHVELIQAYRLAAIGAVDRETDFLVAADVLQAAVGQILTAGGFLEDDRDRAEVAYRESDFLLAVFDVAYFEARLEKRLEPFGLAIHASVGISGGAAGIESLAYALKRTLPGEHEGHGPVLIKNRSSKEWFNLINRSRYIIIYK